MIPVPVPITRQTYPIVFYVILFTFPFLLLIGDKKPATSDWISASIVSVVLAASFVFIQWRCSSWAMSYWDAIGARCLSLETGCVNITILYIFPVLLVYHVSFLVKALLSLSRGRTYAQLATLDFARDSLPKEYPYREVKRLLLSGEGQV